MKYCFILTTLIVSSCTINLMVTSTVGSGDDVDPDTISEQEVSPNVKIPTIPGL
jgi:hypothetical protein